MSSANAFSLLNLKVNTSWNGKLVCRSRFTATGFTVRLDDEDNISESGSAVILDGSFFWAELSINEDEQTCIAHGCLEAQGQVTLLNKLSYCDMTRHGITAADERVPGAWIVLTF